MIALEKTKKTTTTKKQKKKPGPNGNRADGGEDDENVGEETLTNLRGRAPVFEGRLIHMDVGRRKRRDIRGKK